MAGHSHFFAHMARLKLINRWPLMRNIQTENVQEHSLQVAMIAHALALIGNEYFEKEYDANAISTLALYHDASEVLTGDLPSPVKYFNPNIAKEYKKIEVIAEQKLVDMLPERLKKYYQPLVCSIDHDASQYQIVKAADILSAYLKTLEELSAGNHEFKRASEKLNEELDSLPLEEVKLFRETFVESFKLSLDEISVQS
ncbi:5'-deoxynucleotidase [Catenovulum sp. SM1970]|uniref:5'-deoxynucleotidase n=1 Tax=Marinifaba aquimaris TaxID=2741323 RepID=UPI001573C26B|nr:5'-deoxynucleotidase [Marinifaba aquimaris]NTS77932.1 5'-deoxynucleotidase [Marinifaba aquimaris]